MGEKRTLLTLILICSLYFFKSSSFNLPLVKASSQINILGGNVLFNCLEPSLLPEHHTHHWVWCSISVLVYLLKILFNWLSSWSSLLSFINVTILLVKNRKRKNFCQCLFLLAANLSFHGFSVIWWAVIWNLFLNISICIINIC